MLASVTPWQSSNLRTRSPGQYRVAALIPTSVMPVQPITDKLWAVFTQWPDGPDGDPRAVVRFHADLRPRKFLPFLTIGSKPASVTSPQRDNVSSLNTWKLSANALTPACVTLMHPVMSNCSRNGQYSPSAASPLLLIQQLGMRKTLKWRLPAFTRALKPFLVKP
eukprot:jgi/Mesvir1/3440/Mv11936-RA.1